MADLDFNQLINTKASDVKAPTLLPTGHYEAMIAGPMSPHKARSGNVAMRFPIQITAPGDDVDAEVLNDAGGIPDKKYNLDYWMSPDAQFRFKDFCASCGMDVDNLTLSELAEQLVENSQTFTVEVKHEADSNDASKVYMRIDNAVGPEGAAA